MTSFKFSRRIGRGGMAEVFLALQEGLGGFEKLVVVKRIFPHFCEDAEFVQMFFDEARLAASINHPNVVEILDVQRDDRGLFLVMEYLSGETVSYLQELHQSKTMGPVPVHIATRIGIDVASGLHGAHTAEDANGDCLDIVHRDVTPSNVLVCYNGITKVLDFGVAKASFAREESRPGAIKGKVGYLAPEQLEGGEVGPHTDVFQLGVVLHELLTGHRLFRGANDHKIMNAVLEDSVERPGLSNPKVPRALDRIVMSALERDPMRRIQSAAELRESLEGFLKHYDDSASHADVAAWMKTACAERYADRVKLERQCVQELRSSLGDTTDSQDVPAMFSPFAETAPIGVAKTGNTIITVIDIPAPTSGGMTAPGTRRRASAVTAGIGAAALAIGVWVWTRPDEPAARASSATEPAPDEPSEPMPAPAPEPAAPALTVVADVEPDPPPPPAAPESDVPAPAPTVAAAGRSHVRRDPPRPKSPPAATVAPAEPAASTPAPPPEPAPEPARPRTDNRDPWAQ